MRKKKQFPKDIISKGDDKKRIPCPECNGEGTVYGSYDANTNGRFYFILGACPICSGEGIILKEK